MGLFGNKSFNKKKAPVRKTVSLNNLSTNPTVRAADLHPDPENVSARFFCLLVETLVIHYGS